jgi:hypothetical protein
VIAEIVSGLTRRPDVRVMMVSGSTDEHNEIFAADVGLHPSDLIRTDMSMLRLRYIPALVVADKTGQILLAREGLLTETDRNDVMRAVRPPIEN